MLYMLVITVVDVFTFAVSRLSNFTIAVTNVTPLATAPNALLKSDYQVCVTHFPPIEESKTETYNCEAMTFGRYLYIMRIDSKPRILQLCEMKVYVEKRK